MNEEHINSPDGKNASIYRVCAPAVDYMFEGTEATQDIIDSLALAQRAKLAVRVWEMYAAEIKNV